MRDYAEETKKRVAFIRERLEESGCRLRVRKNVFCHIFCVFNIRFSKLRVI